MCSDSEKVLKVCTKLSIKTFPNNGIVGFFISFCIGVCILVVSLAILYKGYSFESCVFVRFKFVGQAYRRTGNKIPL